MIAAGALGFATIGITAVIWLIGIIWYVEVGETGLRLTTFAGEIRRVSWSDIASAAPTSVSGLPYLLITTNAGGPKLYLALWLATRDDLAPYIERYAGQESPLKRWLDAPMVASPI